MFCYLKPSSELIMFVIRETFTAKPGMASKLALLFKDLLSSIPGHKHRVLTDHVGPFNTVVIESEVEDMAEYERQMAEYSSRQDMRDKMKGYTEMYQSGRREIYKVI
jgi:hypothetical protein